MRAGCRAGRLPRVHLHQAVRSDGRQVTCNGLGGVHMVGCSTRAHDHRSRSRAHGQLRTVIRNPLGYLAPTSGCGERRNSADLSESRRSTILQFFFKNFPASQPASQPAQQLAASPGTRCGGQCRKTCYTFRFERDNSLGGRKRLPDAGSWTAVLAVGVRVVVRAR